MAHDDAQGDDALLAALAGALGEHDAWSPGEDAGASVASLPGRQPGEALQTRTHPVSGARALVSDCGTSRFEGRTHVLLVSEQARPMLGDAFARMGEAIAERVGSDGFDWEGDVHLHVTAPGRVWEDVLRTARDAVADLAASRTEAG